MKIATITLNNGCVMKALSPSCEGDFLEYLICAWGWRGINKIEYGGRSFIYNDMDNFIKRIKQGERK